MGPGKPQRERWPPLPPVVAEEEQPAPPPESLAEVAEPPARMPPGFPPDAVIVVADADGHYPDDRRFSGPHMWCWIDGPTWFYLKNYPIPNLKKALT